MMVHELTVLEVPKIRGIFLFSFYLIHDSLFGHNLYHIRSVRQAKI